MSQSPDLPRPEKHSSPHNGGGAASPPAMQIKTDAPSVATSKSGGVQLGKGTSEAPKSEDPPRPAGGGRKHLSCKMCHTVWPVDMLVLEGLQHYCRPCVVLRAEEATRLARRNKKTESKIPRPVRIGVMCAVLAVSLSFSVRYMLVSLGIIAKKVPPKVGALSAEPWVTATPAQWPAIMTACEITFREGPALTHPTSFFLKNGMGRVLGVTGSAPSVKSISLSELHERISQVTFTTPGKGSVTTKAVAGLPNWPADFGMWTFRVPAENSSPLPSIVLRLRPIPAEKGLAVVVLTTDKETQVPTPGVVFHSETNGAALAVTLSQSRKAGDLRGAPIIDLQGYLVGVVLQPLGSANDEAVAGVVVGIGGTSLEEMIR